MLRPSARIAKAQALAAASMFPSLPERIGKRTAPSSNTAMRMRRRRVAGTRWMGASKDGRADRVLSTIGPALGFLRGLGPQQPGGLEHQHQDQDREDDDVGPADGHELSAHAFDESDQDAADHRADDVADAAEHRGGKGAEPRRIADDEAGEVVVEAEDEAGGAGESGTE